MTADKIKEMEKGKVGDKRLIKIAVILIVLLMVVSCVTPCIAVDGTSSNKTDYAHTVFKEGVNGNIEARENNVIFKFPLSNDQGEALFDGITKEKNMDLNLGEEFPQVSGTWRLTLSLTYSEGEPGCICGPTCSNSFLGHSGDYNFFVSQSGNSFSSDSWLPVTIDGTISGTSVTGSIILPDSVEPVECGDYVNFMGDIDGNLISGSFSGHDCIYNCRWGGTFEVKVKPIPVLLVYGWYGSSETWVLMKPWLKEDGYTVEILDYDMHQHAAIAAETLSQKIEDMLDEYNVSKVDIIAHSFGGLVSRHYIESEMEGDENIRNLIMLDTPNHGSLLADYLIDEAGKDPNLVKIAFKVAWSLGVGKDWGSTEDIKFENNSYLEGLNRNFNPGATKYYVTIGTKPIDIAVLGPISSYKEFLPGPDDGAVNVSSARLPGVSLYCAEDNHLSVSKSRTVYTSIIIPILSGQQPTPIGPCPTEDPNDNQVIPIILEGIHVNLRTGEMYVDFFSVSINLLRYWIGFRERDCDFDFRLISPSGDVIDPDVAANDPNISYVANETEGNDHYWYYIINNPEPGIWQYKITALEVPGDGVDIEIFNIFRNATPPEITSFAPPSPVNDTICTWRTFNVTVNQRVNVSWYLNDALQQTNESVTKASCTLHANVSGEHNVTAIASNPNGTDMQTWIWNVTEESSHTFVLSAGWNMISFPVEPLDKDADTIFGPEYYYLCTWNPDTGGYVPVDVVETEIGYWLLVLADRNVTVLGTQLSEYITDITQGWNMIGSLWTATNVPGGTETVPADQMYPYIYGWCGDHYVLTQDIEPGLGYWALAYVDCELHVFPAPPAAPLPVQQITWGDNDWHVRLALTSGAGTDVAEFGLHEDATDDFSAELDVPEPPSPPPSSATYQQVYFYNPENPLVNKLSTCYIPHYFDDEEEYNSWLFIVEYSGDASDVTVTWNAKDINAVPAEYSLLFIADGEQIDMRTTPSYTFRAKTRTYEFEIRAITGGKKPDLVIEDSYEKGKAGSYIVFFVVKNIGTATAPEGHYAMLYVNGVEKDKKLVPTDLEPGETYKGSFKTKVGLTGKVENIKVCADSYNDVDELDEDNNCLKGRWQHVEKPTTDKPPTDKRPIKKPT